MTLILIRALLSIYPKYLLSSLDDIKRPSYDVISNVNVLLQTSPIILLLLGLYNFSFKLQDVPKFFKSVF